MKLLLLSVLLTSLAFPPFNLSWLIWIALVPLFIPLIQPDTPQKLSWRQGLMFSTLHLAIFHRWMFALDEWVALGWIMLLLFSYSLYLGAFYAIAIRLFEKLKTTAISKVLLIPALLTLADYLRGLGPIGNPAATMGYSQTHSPLILAASGIIGVFGISFMIYLVNTCLALAWVSQQKQRYLLSAAFILSLTLGLGTYQISAWDHNKGQSIPVVIMQGNHPQKTKLNPRQHTQIRQDYLNALRQLSLQQNTLIVWPETLTPSLNLSNANFIKRLSRELQQSESGVLLGSPSYNRNKDIFHNTAALVTKEGVAPNPYHKLKLMPFGEYWPFKSLLIQLGFEKWAAGAEYSPGDHLTLLNWKETKVGTTICLESIYPWTTREQVLKGANILVTLVNNAWFFDSVAAEQHLHMTQFRASETGRYTLQAGNTGLSAIISPTGKLLKQSSLDQKQTLSASIYPIYNNTRYTQLGDLAVFISGYILLFLGIRSRLK